MPTYMKCKNCGQKFYTAANIEITRNKPCPICGGEPEKIAKKEYGDG